MIKGGEYVIVLKLLITKSVYKYLIKMLQQAIVMMLAHLHWLRKEKL